MFNILVTSIGSMSAECVISALKEEGHNVIGCDIYPKEWHYITQKCNSFYKVSLASDCKEYMQDIINICDKESINYIFPLTDIEVDFFNTHLEYFNSKGIVVCISEPECLGVARDKYKLHEHFLNDKNIPSVNTVEGVDKRVYDLKFPLIAKQKNGRSSIGLLHIDTQEQLSQVKDLDNYIFQEKLSGSVYTVDIVRNSKTGKTLCIAREELTRTSNGAGLTVKISINKRITELAEYIANKINVNGCVNIEFIHHNSEFYLIDINPRFSAGVAFSNLCGYNMPINHLKCYTESEIDDICEFEEAIMTKIYKEVILS